MYGVYSSLAVSWLDITEAQQSVWIDEDVQAPQAVINDHISGSGLSNSKVTVSVGTRAWKFLIMMKLRGPIKPSEMDPCG